MSSVQFSSPFSMIQASRARFVSGQAQHALHLGFFSSVVPVFVSVELSAPSGIMLCVYTTTKQT